MEAVGFEPKCRTNRNVQLTLKNFYKTKGKLLPEGKRKTSQNDPKKVPSGHNLVILPVSFEFEINTLAKENVNLFMRLNVPQLSIERVYMDMVDMCENIRIKAPELSEMVTANGAVSRMLSEHWWRRALRNLFTLEIESKAIVENRVNYYSSIYVSNRGLGIHRENRLRNRRLLEQMKATNEEGQELTLAELSDSSISNPENRRNELMCRLAGTEEYAKELGHKAVFATVTCPSRMHSTLQSGKPNPKYDGTMPNDAQRYLVKLWACIRAKFDREGIKVYGFRIAEPHHDGTPHWHPLLFGTTAHLERAVEIIRHYTLLEDGNENGAKKYRFKIEYIDWRKGSAVAYVAKYISKNIDGYKLDTDEYGKDAKNSAERVRAWASIWKIRQFQPIGQPSVTVWRQLRKLKELKGDELAVEGTWLAANVGDWCAYIKAMGGIDCYKGQHTVAISKIWCEDENEYGDPLGWIINGVISKGVFVNTKLHEWKISQVDKSNNSKVQDKAEPGGPPSGGIGESVSCIENKSMTSFGCNLHQEPRASVDDGGCSPWSSVNNCTDSYQKPSVRPPPN
ncbi:MAG: replication endonuclease [Mariprofundaceae bacterium]